jgi:hypothetical protein
LPSAEAELPGVVVVALEHEPDERINSVDVAVDVAELLVRARFLAHVFEAGERVG